MQFKSLAFASALAAVSNAQSLTEAIGGNPDLSQLGTLLGSQQELTQGLAGMSNITLLAPSNEALGAFLNSSAAQNVTSTPGLLEAILQYHVLQGTYQASAIPENETFVPTGLMMGEFANVTGGQRVGVVREGDNVTVFSGGLANSSVTQANVNFTGGVIHIIDSLLTLPMSASETAINAGLSSLAGALTNTSLVETVDSLANVTIFAPNNEAFQNIGSVLANISTEDLASVLQYHVVVGDEPLYSTSLENGTSVPTLAGAEVTITLKDDGSVFVNGAEVVIPNVLIAGGVVHVIDNVLNPSATEAAAPDATEGTVAFPGASSASEAPFTSGIPEPTSSIATESAPGATGASSTAGAYPMVTGAVGAAALFGAGAAVFNF